VIAARWVHDHDPGTVEFGDVGRAALRADTRAKTAEP
jgi:hypothetical protein